MTTGYNVYYAPDGCAEEFLGCVDTLAEAAELVGAGGLPESDYGTAEAAGHCGGLEAPDKSQECVDRVVWLEGGDGYYCAVPLVAASRS